GARSHFFPCGCPRSPNPLANTRPRIVPTQTPAMTDGVLERSSEASFGGVRTTNATDHACDMRSCGFPVRITRQLQRKLVGARQHVPLDSVGEVGKQLADRRLEQNGARERSPEG